MKLISKIAISAILIAATLFPAAGFAAQKFSYGAWLPYWKKQSGALEVALNLEKFSEISPFSYEVNADGSLADKAKLTQGLWPGWLAAARDGHVKIIPTIAWLYGDQIHKLLSNNKLRTRHVANIVSLVKTQKYDGIDIDYEDKRAATGPYFSKFIKELYAKLPKSSILSCTIEARTPADSRFTQIPADLAYANDYKIINRYCDQVRVMAYDQGTIDLKLNAQKGNGALYAPVADSDWIEKVLKETLKTIDRKKVVLGIPTYGYEYEVSWADGATTYKRLRAVTFNKAQSIASSTGAIPERNAAGEMSFSYATSTSYDVSSGLTYVIYTSTTPAVLALAENRAATAVRYVSFVDAKSIAGKIAAAKKYKLAGVEFFKMDGETDPALWGLIK